MESKLHPHQGAKATGSSQFPLQGFVTAEKKKPFSHSSRCTLISKASSRDLTPLEWAVAILTVVCGLASALIPPLSLAPFLFSLSLFLSLPSPSVVEYYFN